MTEISQYPDTQSGVRAENVRVEYENENVVLLRVYFSDPVCLISVGTSGCAPNITVQALLPGDDTVREVSFPDYEGFTVFSADKVSQDLVNVTLSKPVC